MASLVSDTETAICMGVRSYLREVRQSDVNDRYYRWMNDPEVSRYLETRFVAQSLENISKFVAHMDGKSDEPFFAICRRDTNEHIGNIKLGPINWRHRYADISLLIGEKNCWGKGYATEAIGMITQFGFETLNLNKLKAGCYVENEGSARSFEKCGYSREGLQKGQYLIDGKSTDGIILGLCAEDYWKKKA
ncbi:MAG: GNAT family protein [candidate division Zixibacteria bacterium]|nr:GNAT family protein [candidate division Zixibacteria bacterium]